MKKQILSILVLILFLYSCTGTKNWQSTQTANRWHATFDEFSGKEQLMFSSHPGHLIYLSAQMEAVSGKLSLAHSNKEVASTHAITHSKIYLDEKVKLTVKGKKAKGSFLLDYPVYENEQVNVRFNTNMELLSLCYFLTIYDDVASIPEDQHITFDTKQVKVKDLYALNLKIANEFTAFLKSGNFSLIKPYFDKDFYLHYANFVLSLDNFPNAVIESDNKFIGRFETPAHAVTFVNAMNAFYNEINFDNYLLKYKPYYDEMILEVTENLPKEDFITEMEHFYRLQMPGYNLYPSLAMGFSQGFAVGNDTMIGNVFGSFNPPGEINNTSHLDLGFKNSTSLRTLSVHEFGHSFVNPAVDNADEANLKATAILFEPIRDRMSAQGYDQWKICLYEHFVRAGEVIIARHIGDDGKAKEILDDAVTNRYFIYLPQIVEQLEYWYYNEYFTKTYQEKVNEIISKLNSKP